MSIACNTCTYPPSSPTAIQSMSLCPGAIFAPPRQDLPADFPALVENFHLAVVRRHREPPARVQMTPRGQIRARPQVHLPNVLHPAVARELPQAHGAVVRRRRVRVSQRCHLGEGRHHVSVLRLRVGLPRDANALLLLREVLPHRVERAELARRLPFEEDVRRELVPVHGAVRVGVDAVEELTQSRVVPRRLAAVAERGGERGDELVLVERAAAVEIRGLERGAEGFEHVEGDLVVQRGAQRDGREVERLGARRARWRGLVVVATESRGGRGARGSHLVAVMTAARARGGASRGHDDRALLDVRRAPCE
eukprot:30919-Pelagococcus_subviridis.AAC.2